MNGQRGPTLVIIRSSDSRRVAEALRAALGLSLRGDRILVVALEGAVAHLFADADPRIKRARRTLAELGQKVLGASDSERHVGSAELGDLIRQAHAVEVWT